MCYSPTLDTFYVSAPLQCVGERRTTMPEFNTGEVQANGLRFHYLEIGEGPLALCLHGFPDSPYSYRYLLPELAEAGYRAVAPFNRGFAPTELPAERHHVHSSTMVNDALALHEALGANGDAVIIAHDWGAVAAWGAVGQEPERWRRGAILNIPPFAVFEQTCSAMTRSSALSTSGSFRCK